MPRNNENSSKREIMSAVWLAVFFSIIIGTILGVIIGDAFEPFGINDK